MDHQNKYMNGFGWRKPEYPQKTPGLLQVSNFIT